MCQWVRSTASFACRYRSCSSSAVYAVWILTRFGTVDEGVAPSASVSEPYVRLLPHTAPLSESLCHRHQFPGLECEVLCHSDLAHKHGATRCVESPARPANKALLLMAPSDFSIVLDPFLLSDSAHVSLSWALPQAFAFSAILLPSRLRSGHLLSGSTTNESDDESYPVPTSCFALL
jgi:hypothetical protein